MLRKKLIEYANIAVDGSVYGSLDFWDRVDIDVP
jgi:hypothetical protein